MGSRSFKIFSSNSNKYSSNSRELHCYETDDGNLAAAFMEELTEQGHTIHELILPGDRAVSKETPSTTRTRQGRR